MSDKLQFVAGFHHSSTAESPDKLKFVGHFWIRQQYQAGVTPQLSIIYLLLRSRIIIFGGLVMNSTIPVDLLELKTRFETWRINRKYMSDPIPDELWNAAAELSRRHPTLLVGRVLKLDPRFNRTSPEVEPQYAQLKTMDLADGRTGETDGVARGRIEASNKVDDSCPLIPPAG